MKDLNLSKKKFMAILGLSLAGNIYLVPYLMYTFYDPMLEVFKMTNAQCGLLISVFSLGCMILYIPGGIISDKLNTKKILMYSHLATAVLTVVLAFFMNFYFALVAWGLYALTASFLFWTAIMKAVRIVGGKDDSGSTYGWYYALGSVVGFGLGLVQIYIFDFFEADAHRAMFWVFMSAAATNLLCMLVVKFMYNEDEMEVESQEEEAFKLSDIPKLARNKYLWGAMIVMFCIYFVYNTSYYFTPYLTARIGLEVTDSALIANIRAYLLFFLSPFAGYVADKILHSTLKMASICCFLTAVLFVSVTFVPSGEQSKMLAVVLSLVVAAILVMLYGIIWSILNEVKIPVEYTATAIGFVSVVMYAPDLFMEVLYGHFLDVYGNEGGYFRIFMLAAAMAVITGIASLALAISVKKKDKREASAEVEERSA